MSLWNKISTIGVTPDTPFSLYKEKKLTNRFYWIIFSIHLLYIPVIIFLKLDRLFIPFGLVIASFALIFSFLKRGKHELGAFLILVTETIFLCFISTLGYEGYFFFYLIPLYILAMIVIANKALSLSITLILIGVFLISSFLQHHFYDPKISSPTLAQIFFIINNTIIILISVYAIFHYKLINREYEHNLNFQKNKIEKQHKALNSLHKDVQDSINYAQRIQKAILPSSALIAKHFKQNFLIYRPKDVISGDFYWLQVIGDDILFAVADCTGHGVPGAMLSLICHNSLNKSVKEFHLKSPSLILKKTNELISSTLMNINQSNIDKMNISMIKLPVNYPKKEHFQLEYIGINQPLFLITENILKSFSPNRRLIDSEQTQVSYNTHKITINKGDSIYLFTDGFYTQIGGNNNKKLKSKNFKKLIEENSHLTLNQQEQKLNDFFYEWQGRLPQIDDICIIGLKF
ncbi:MAG: SpoIIE family protein phosphatase [Flavobacteriales bacterium]|jgi:serine phosphatase RsbU (regulator of sigma subunit)|nr:SpoIIE family protein phosphatase [Flavobacteriales bacterium]